MSSVQLVFQLLHIAHPERTVIKILKLPWATILASHVTEHSRWDLEAAYASEQLNLFVEFVVKIGLYIALGCRKVLLPKGFWDN